ncbi:sigma-54-dependent transcriptional regulator [Peribacillus cavernae]|uniref:Sigma-54-dependent transcriptional regulator n=1 Tax=Peribacillus cavernae TaxID=1674310 RepID=A0A433H969_9BACI|nr:sigma-54-dependent Fis family transcriptional regulator [Peribacillus cavernae]MDQ0220788.1 PAS domain S-box-containing protein [Peribacillus cavernae]RUQ24785.1 sigma-54-dependent transcriptional regulator [Peribacillus cavernae]
MQKVMIVGAGTGGTAILKILMESESFFIECVVDTNMDAPGMQLAKKLGIQTGSDWKRQIHDSLDIIIEVTGDEQVFEEIRDRRSGRTLLIPGSVAYIIAKLFEEKKELIDKLKNEKNKHDLIFNTTNDGMIVVDKTGIVILFNRSAERMVEAKRKDVVGKHITELIPGSRLPHTIQTKRMELNQEQVLNNGMKIITTRIPLLDENNEVIGAFAVFKDITEVVNLAEEITNLKEIQTMLQAIIHSSNDAISVVDEKGHGIVINPAYTRITGLSKEEVIGKPATTDIYEGESMHMQVLQTRRPVRGVNLRVGPLKKDVIVNVAPIIVDNRLKGSVGVIHDVSEIQQLTKELDRARQIIRTLEAKYSFADIIGQSEEMKLAVEQAKLSAKTPATVLLRGESGTGKELFAHAIHNASEKKFNKFVRVNCAAISESLLESELFGYEEGAFSGAKRGGKRGFFEEANKGSIFLDEIGELSPNIQAKLLRVLQENEIIRVGGTKPVPIKVRVIAATNLNLEKAITIGTFREDLYFRLNRMPIHISPLRKRKEEIEAMAKHLIQKINQEYGRNIEGITDEAIEKLKQYDWPGNVRELENILGRAIIFMKINESVMDEEHIPDFIENDEKILNDPNLGKEGAFSQQEPLSEMLDRYESKLIKQSLIQHKGNKTATAKSLRISVRNLYYKIEKLNLENFSMQ